MEHSKFLKTVIIILLLINIGTLAYLLTNNNRPNDQPLHGNSGAVDFLTHELKLSVAQQKQFEELRNAHRRTVESIHRQSRKVHDDYFNMLANPSTDSTMVNAGADSILALQKQIELITYYHFKKVRTICTPEQQKRFDEIISEALARMAPRPPRH